MEDLERKLEILDKEVDESMNIEGLVVSRRDRPRWELQMRHKKQVGDEIQSGQFSNK